MADPYSLETLPPGKVFAPEAIAAVPEDWDAVRYDLTIVAHPDHEDVPIGAWVEPEPPPFRTFAAVFEFGDGVSVPPTNAYAGAVDVPIGCAVREWHLECEPAGTVEIDVQSRAYGGAYASIITGSTDRPKATTATEAKDDDGTLTNWATTIAAATRLRAKLVSVATAKLVTLTLVLEET